ncbi:radical SAM protein [Rhodopseudomonas sp. HC1]|uniref:radical SAM protein n=1 Tax=Rhodopseudomonas infernalis TaxID=2897386 RepID=UPI001EE7B021|nr:radical SAM protein [Rhodopseudomonas infernalis]MCG6203440.1 radical SAM protein [Rhodopseudomonas infernalis]
MTEGGAGLSQTMTTPMPAFPAPDGNRHNVLPSVQTSVRITRLNLPVSPTCNVDCAFCAQAFDQQDHHSDQASRLLTPTQAIELVTRTRALSPTLSVVGISGPGEPLATHHALDALAKVHERWPDLALCLSTNGLLLPDQIDHIAAFGITTLTVTVNAVDPVIQARITPSIAWRHRRLDGIEAAERLIGNQIDGIAQASARGLAVKVNTVLIPTVNEDHISDIAERVAHAGAHLINIIPLVPQHRFAHLPAPGLMKRYVARADAERYLRVSHHCQQCAADACGTAPNDELATALCSVADIRTEPTFSHG